jgi:hypothetical protein
MEPILKYLGWPASLIIAACLSIFGLVVLFYMFSHSILRRGHHGGVRRIAAIFGAVGLLAPAGVGATALINNEVGELLRPLWPTSFVAMAGENGDPHLYMVLLFGVAVLSNVGLYGLIGLIFGGGWTWIRRKQSATLGGIDL